MTGKNKCRILKEIRKRIAEENDISYVTSECKFQGECSGTCPKCEAEVRYLEEELNRRQRLGKRIAVAGVAAALVVSTSACGSSEMQTEDLFGRMELETFMGAPSATEEILLQGDIALTEPIYVIGEVPYTEAGTTP